MQLHLHKCNFQRSYNMIYQLTNNSFGQPNGVKKTDDNNQVWFIPNDPANTDYQAYLKWVDEGGITEPANE